MRHLCSRIARGFSLVELMIVIGIISLVAALAVPRYLRRQATLRQEGCRNELVRVAGLQRDAWQRERRLVTDWRALGLPEGKAGRYQCQLTPGEGGQFTIECRGNIDFDQTLDVQRAGATGPVEQVSDDLQH